jgi:hypothetical protein
MLRLQLSTRAYSATITVPHIRIFVHRKFYHFLQLCTILFILLRFFSSNYATIPAYSGPIPPFYK